ncbi:hypothetical protein EZV73_00580 [Acidaminobacter sp. JC074]|uniref:hypothetical protein n=1 Tax=Acidaminobacter sp. JC074 TaxID=2530199 RepID=UPI001F101255|nr:hypothetical protein [Acidaminobacter sp. JC074]MCH4886035.1 hypothetical protein [Acidaminobacter sp. JC074]
MDVAYSKEYEKVIDAEKAYELFWEGIIKDYRGFTCPGVGCDAQVTLANAKRERHSMKQRPNFRCYGEHIPSCEHKGKKKVKCLDILVLSSKKRSKKKGLSKIDYQKQSSSGSRQSEYRTIMPIVNKFIDYKKAKLLDQYEILNQGKRLTYYEMFLDLSGEFDYFTKFNRIYYGPARIVKSKDKDDYIIFFKKSLTYKGEKYKPTAYVSKRIIDNSYRNKLWLKELSLLAEEKAPVHVFIYGKAKVHTKDEKSYLNIEICRAKLDLVDIRRDC